MHKHGNKIGRTLQTQKPTEDEVERKRQRADRKKNKAEKREHREYEEWLLIETQAKKAVHRSRSGPTVKSYDKGPEARRKEVERLPMSGAKRVEAVSNEG